MMRDRPYAAQLLAEARRLLVEAVVPSVSSQTRYQALMIGKAMDLAERQLNASCEIEEMLEDRLRGIVQSDGSLPQLTSLLSHRIREGSFDRSGEVYKFLRLVVAFKLQETNPPKVNDKIKRELDQLLLDNVRR